MPHKKPRRPTKPFFTHHPQIARAIAEDSDQSRLLPDQLLEENTDAPDVANVERYARDWVDRADDALIEASPAKRASLELYGSRENVPLDTWRIILKHREGAMTGGEFMAKLEAPGDSRRSIISILRYEGALADRPGSPSGFHPNELFALYVKHRWTPADALLAQYATRDGRTRMVQLSASCRALSSELRWLVPISECFDDHPMVDEMRRSVLRAGGSPDHPQEHPGWLRWFAEWLNEAAHKLERSPGGAVKAKEVAFQLGWYDQATSRTPGNRHVLWDVGRRLFLLTFPDPPDRFNNAADFRRVVMRHVKKRDT